MTDKPRWLFWLRGTLLSALTGHWVANALFDPDQYSEASLEYSWRASLPILVQTFLVLVVVVGLGPLSRRSVLLGRRGPARPSLRRLLTLFVTSQVLLFLAMELSERVVQREPFGDGLLSSGFVLELVFAIGSALLLAALGTAAARVIRSFRRQPATSAVSDRLGLLRRTLAPTHPVVLVGGVRAPPPLSA
jgi:hypothetical protein